MDKPKKQILYRPSDNVRVLAKEKNTIIENVITDVTLKVSSIDSNSGEKLAEWIKSASLINKSALCKIAKIDRGNLDKFLSKGVIPHQHVKIISLILKDYGYAK